MIYIVPVFVILALMELPPLLKQKKTRELVVVCCLFAGVFTIALLLALGVKLPSPLSLLGDFTRDVLHLSY